MHVFILSWANPSSISKHSNASLYFSFLIFESASLSDRKYTHKVDIRKQSEFSFISIDSNTLLNIMALYDIKAYPNNDLSNKYLSMIYKYSFNSIFIVAGKLISNFSNSGNAIFILIRIFHAHIQRHHMTICSPYFFHIVNMF